MKRAVVGLAALCVVLAAAVVFLVTTRSHGSNTTTSTTTSTSTTTTVAAACDASNFTATYASLGAAAGTSYGSVSLTNEGAACSYSGSPHVTFPGATPALNVTVSNAPFESVSVPAPPSPTPGVVANGGAIVFDLSYPNFGSGAASCSSLQSMTIGFSSGGTTSVSLFGKNVQPCSSMIISSLFATP